MYKVHTVDSWDKYLPLVSDVLPYELPLWFSSTALYEKMRDDEGFYLKIFDYNNKKKKDFIPLSFKISRGDLKYRKISVMHPVSQIVVCDFYNESGSLFLYYCSISDKSLRAPVKKSSKFYGKWDSLGSASEGVEVDVTESIFPSSYFKYNKYAFLYSFYDSYEYHRLEKKFPYLISLDVSKCFSSIYSHSLSWAMKGKEFSKLNKNKKGGFDSNLDSILMRMNHQETNGILVGPEFSRLAAEIIFQRIDLDFILNAKKKERLIVGVDFDFRRYVDDYFLYARNDLDKKKLIKLLDECLEEYKLHLNEAKTIEQKRPFSTNISRCKAALRELLGDIYKARYTSEGEVSQTGRPDRLANSYISKIKRVCSDYNVEYKSISGFLLGLMLRKVNDFIARFPESDSVDYFDWLLVDVELVYFFYSMDVRVVTTDKLAKICVRIIDYIAKFSERESLVVYKKIFDCNRHALESVVLEIDGFSTGVEATNLLFVHSLLPEKYKLKEKFLINYYNTVSDHNGMDYMVWVSFMMYVKKDVSYENIYCILKEKAERYFSETTPNFYNTEYILFLLDYLACDFVEKNTRVALAERLEAESDWNLLPRGNRKILTTDFIAPWRDEDFFRKILKKRAFTFPY